MSTKLDLKSTEKASYKLATYADGTNDITLGLVLVLLGIYPYSREWLGVVPNAIIHLALMASIAFGILWAKKGLTHSRIGLVKFGDKAKQRTKVAFLVSFITVFLTSLVWVLSTNGYFLPKSSWLGQYGFDILIAVVILVLFSALAYSLNIIRFYLYGVLFAASIPLQVFLPRLKWFPLIASGIIITAIGVYLLIQFLKGFPAVDAEMDGGEEVAHE